MSDDPATPPPATGTPVAGTPARPAFTRQPALFVTLLLVYLAWVAVMVVWSVQLHRR